MPTDLKPGEVWFAELGMVEKSRPVLVLAFPGSDDARAIAIVAPLTFQIIGMRGEVDLGKPRWLPQTLGCERAGSSQFRSPQTHAAHGSTQPRPTGSPRARIGITALSQCCGRGATAVFLAGMVESRSEGVNSYLDRKRFIWGNQKCMMTRHLEHPRSTICNLRSVWSGVEALD